MWLKVDEESKKKLREKMDLRLLRALAKVWLESLTDSSKRLGLKEGNEMNTFATVISGYEAYHAQHDLYPKLAECIKSTEIANDDRKPGYLVIPSHPGKGKTRTLGELVNAAMHNGLQEPLKELLDSVYCEKLKEAFGLTFTFNDKMADTLMHGEFPLFEAFRKVTPMDTVIETDLVARFAFW